MDTPPGQVAESEFGCLGMFADPETGRRRAVWAMIIVLGHSRDCLLWPMHQQRLEDVITGLQAAWAFFGGMPQYLVIDNCPAAVEGHDSLNPALTRGSLEYAQHRGFIVDQERKGHPQDKSKVERGEPYEIGEWRSAKVHPDHHIQCRQSLYSVLSDLCPPVQEVAVRVGSKLVRIYHRGRLNKVNHSSFVLNSA